MKSNNPTIIEKCLDGKFIIITGGCGLIGKEFCSCVVRAGGTVIISDMNEAEGLTFQKELNTGYDKDVAYFFKTDITDSVSVESLIRFAAETIGRIDALVNTAYPRNDRYGAKLEDVYYDSFCENINLHLGGYFLTCQKFAAYFKKQGQGNIINMSSIYGVVSPSFDIYHDTEMTMPVEYAAIKSSLIFITKYMAKYYKGSNIRFNCISPGGIYDNQPECFVKNYNSKACTKGMLDTDDLNGTLLYLLSDLSAYVNGQNLIVDDGWSL